MSITQSVSPSFDTLATRFLQRYKIARSIRSAGKSQQVRLLVGLATVYEFAGRHRIASHLIASHRHGI